jgi:hypothetical protein
MKLIGQETRRGYGHEGVSLHARRPFVAVSMASDVSQQQAGFPIF